MSFCLKNVLSKVGFISQPLYKSIKFRNLSFRLVTKARACKSAGQEGSMGGTSYIPKNVGECERMNPHIPK